MSLLGIADFVMSKYISEYSRNYLMIIDFLSNVGGMISILFIILGTIINPIAQFIYSLELTNMMYKREDKKSIFSYNRLISFHNPQVQDIKVIGESYFKSDSEIKVESSSEKEEILEDKKIENNKNNDEKGFDDYQGELIEKDNEISKKKERENNKLFRKRKP